MGYLKICLKKTVSDFSSVATFPPKRQGAFFIGTVLYIMNIPCPDMTFRINYLTLPSCRCDTSKHVRAWLASAIGVGHSSLDVLFLFVAACCSSWIV